MVGTVRVGACFDKGNAVAWRERLGVDGSDFVSGEGWFEESLEVGGKGDGVLELFEPLERWHVARFEMSLPDIIEDRVSRSDAIVEHVFFVSPVVVRHIGDGFSSPAEGEVCHEDVPDWFGVVDGVCHIPKLHIAGPVRIVPYKTTFFNEVVQGVVVVTVAWDVGIDEGKDLLDAEVAIVEGCAIGEGTDDGPASPDAYHGRGTDEVIPEPWRDVDVVERFWVGFVVWVVAE